MFPAGSTARTLKVCVPSASVAEIAAARCTANAVAVELALERRAGSRSDVTSNGLRPDEIVVSGGVGVDAEGAGRGRRVDVPGGVGGADLERVRAIGERR